ncbi:hypothetical protein DNTS_016932 [Danionella cerebrum]|nr:hypothetical protein DNTS_016932 [Danionella translucida]
MAVAVPKLSSGGIVKIRLSSGDLGTTKWKEGVFEILENDNKISLQVKFNSGGPPRIFQLSHNLKQVSWFRMQGPNRMTLTLKDSRVVMMDNLNVSLAKKMKEYLEMVKHGKPAVLKTNQGSGSFGLVLGNRVAQNDSSSDRQVTPRRSTLENREDCTPRKPLGSPSRVSTTPGRTGLSENRSEKRKRQMNSDGDLSEDYTKENDSSSNNKAITDTSRKYLLSYKEKQKQSEENRGSAPLTPAPLQPTSFYGSRSAGKDYTHSFVDRPSSTNSAKRSLMLPNHSTPFKKIRANLDYSGWNKPRPSVLAQPQPPLQGFSNLGNTCYMNAILQSLFSLPSFSSDLLKQGIPWRRVPLNALLRRFANLLEKKDVSTPEVKKDLLRRVKNAISSTAERFSGYMQNDAHEFLSQCLDQLKEDVEKINKSCRSEQSLDEPQSGARLAEEPDASRIYTCPVTTNMEFEVQHTITCKSCGEVVTKREQFNDLSIDLPRRKKTLPMRSIQDSLDLFFRVRAAFQGYSSGQGWELRDGGDRVLLREMLWKSSQRFSQVQSTAQVRTPPHHLPCRLTFILTPLRLCRVLILHLKRYSYNTQLSLNSKLGQQVLIPKFLTLLSHCTEATRSPLSLGWSAHNTLSRTLKTSQTLNSSTVRRGSQRPEVDSDSEEELVRKVARKHHTEEERTDEAQDFSGINDEEMLAAVLGVSGQEASVCEDEPSSSPDTGFGDADPHELELLDKQPPAADALDENKENQTPEEACAPQGELDWVHQFGLDQEREEQELQQALAQSLQEHEAREMREDDDLKRATELSLQEFNNSLPELLCSDEDSGNEDGLEMEYSEAQAEELRRNAESGELPNSFRLISVVSHIGSSSSSGHYISDVFDMRKQSWLTYNDLDVSRTQEAAVQRDRDRSGYIFFYMHSAMSVLCFREVFEELSELEKAAASTDASRTVLQPL